MTVLGPAGKSTDGAWQDLVASRHGVRCDRAASQDSRRGLSGGRRGAPSRVVRHALSTDPLIHYRITRTALRCACTEKVTRGCITRCRSHQSHCSMRTAGSDQGVRNQPARQAP